MYFIVMAEDEAQLQVLLDFTDSWCKKWKMKVNVDKTKSVHFRKRRVARTLHSFYLGDAEVEKVDKYKYLGVYLDEHLDYRTTAGTLAGAAGRALGGVISKFKSLRNVGFETFTKLYHSGVVPVMDYCSGVWGFKIDNSCDKIQQRALRYYLGVHSKSPLSAIEGETGWLNTESRRHVEMFRLWNRILSMNEDRLTRKMFEYDYAKCKDNWCYEIKQICIKVGKMNMFTEKQFCNISEMQNALKGVFIEKWQSELVQKPKLRTYICFKDEYCTENYVKYCISRRERSLLAQLRIGILPLHIETGRFRGLDLEDRTCQICNTQEIEDELHFICACNEYNNPRQILYNKISEKSNEFNVLTDKDKFIFIMKHEWKLLCAYLNDSWNIRNSIMYR